jgi:hypothetical protein
MIAWLKSPKNGIMKFFGKNLLRSSNSQKKKDTRFESSQDKKITLRVRQTLVMSKLVSPSQSQMRDFMAFYSVSAGEFLNYPHSNKGSFK